MNDYKGVVFDISHFMTEDGPGIRTSVFVKGCPLRCKWCSNAYGLKIRRQLAVIQKKCSGCGKCISRCPDHLIRRNEAGEVITDYQNCKACGKCTDACLNSARAVIGREYTVEEVLEQVLQDKDFYKRNGGGVTFSGGEILAQPEFVKEALRACKEEHLHTAIETSGFGSWETLHGILTYTDFVFMDLKAMDDETHRRLTGQGNRQILDNIRKTAAYCAENKKDMVLRFPLIPGQNDDEENIRATAEFSKGLGDHVELNILPYHKLGIGKYENIGETYELEDISTISTEEMERYKKILEEERVNYSIGGANVKKYESYR